MGGCCPSGSSVSGAAELKGFRPSQTQVTSYHATSTSSPKPAAASQTQTSNGHAPPHSGSGEQRDSVGAPVDATPSANNSILVPVETVTVVVEQDGGSREEEEEMRDTIGVGRVTKIKSTQCHDGRMSLKIPINEEAQDLIRRSEVKLMKLRPQDLKEPVDLDAVRLSISAGHLVAEAVAPMDDYHRELQRSRQLFESRYQEGAGAGSEKAVTLREFQVKRILGSGSFGVVALVRHQEKKNVMALKAMYKETIIRQKQVDHVMNEKTILRACRWPFLLRMYYSFQDALNLYLALEFVNGGEMFNVLRRNVKFSTPQCKFYAAQVAMAFEYLHSLDVVYRDLKPENILFDRLGYVKICDFGFAKRIRGRTYTLCGTPEYLAPEIIQSKGYGKAVDWWSYGILVYEMSAGFPPFNPDTTISDPGKRYVKLYESIIMDKLRFPAHFQPELRHFLRHLLMRDSTKRFGNLRQGVEDIKDHPWFEDLDWSSVFEKRCAAPYKPSVNSDDDASLFPNQANKQDESVFKKALGSRNLLDKYQKEFADF